MIGRVLALAAVFSGSVATAQTAPRQPTGKWIVNFDDAQCVATRYYGTAENPIYFVLKAPPIGDVLQIGIVRKGAPRDATQVEGEVVFDNQPPIRTNLLEFGVSRLRQHALLVNLPAQDLVAMRGASVVRIQARNRGMSKLGTRLSIGSSRSDESFALSDMTELLKMMQTCTDDLRKVWNVYDEKQPGPLKEPPSGDLVRLFDADDYPAVALLKGQMGTVALELCDHQGTREVQAGHRPRRQTSQELLASTHLVASAMMSR
jgi:hypothetical protein